MYLIQGKTYTWQEVQQYMHDKKLGFITNGSQVIFREDLL